MFHNLNNMCKYAILLGLVLANFSHALVILRYEDISDKRSGSLVTSSTLFKSHLATLEKYDFNILSADELHRIVSQKQQPPDRSAVITFDGARQSLVTEVVPLLKGRKWPFIVFVNTKAHDEKQADMLSWKQLKILKKGYKKLAIGNLSDSHAHMIRKIEGESHREFTTRRAKDIEFAEKRIKKQLGLKTKIFAYPYGEYDSELRRLLAERGYIALTNVPGPIAKTSHPQSLPRFSVVGREGEINAYTTKIASLPFPMIQAFTNDRHGRDFDGPELPLGVKAPTLRLTSPILPHIKEVSCTVSGRVQANTSRKGKMLFISVKGSLPVGRSRYDCMAHANGGRFFWYSHLFIQRGSGGLWYKE